MKIEALVPDFKLCQLIPEDTFTQSAFVFARRAVKNTLYTFLTTRELYLKQKKFYNAGCYPAPTLHELMVALSKFGETSATLYRPQWMESDSVSVIREDGGVSSKFIDRGLENNALVLFLECKKKFNSAVIKWEDDYVKTHREMFRSRARRAAKAEEQAAKKRKKDKKYNRQLKSLDNLF